MVESDSLSWKPQVESDCASWMMGLKVIKNIRGDSVSPWKTPLLIGKLGVDQFFLTTRAVN